MAPLTNIVLDTAVLFNLFKKNKTVERKIRSFLKKNIKFHISTITHYEYFRGAHTNDKLVQKKLFNLNQVYARLNPNFIDFNESMADSCSLIYSMMQTQGIKDFKHRELDILIGGSASTLQYPLYTPNKKDFKDIPNIKLI